MIETVLSVEEARQRLYETLREDIPFDQKARTALELGKQCLGTDGGILTQIDNENNHWEAAITTGTAVEDTSLKRELDLRETYCSETVGGNTPVTIHDATNEEWVDTPEFEMGGFHTYLGVPLILDEDAYGTICFIAKESRTDPFSDAETRFAEYLTRLLERELKRKHVEAELTNQTNLSKVLNRVLRHNLRNDITVIRGNTELMAEQLDDEPVAETALSHIEDLISLSEKARELEEVISAGSERQHTEITGLIENIADTINSKYPSSSISVNYDGVINMEVLQNFDQAIEELIENAVKHSGDSPDVTVTVETVPNAVEVQIADDGPGLPDNEAEVLTDGKETPLAHGTGLGLWLAYWIITSHDGSLDPIVTKNGTTMRITIPQTPAVGLQQQLTELTRSRDKYKTIFEEANDAIVIINDNGQIISSNPAASTDFGLDDQQLTGRELTEFLPDEFTFETEWREFIQTGDERDIASIFGADGKERVIEYSATADIIPNQHLFFGRDVSKREEQKQELSKLKQRYEALLEAAPDPIFVADVETKELIEVNEAAEALLGEPRDRIIGRHQKTLHPAENAELYQEAFNEAIEKQTTIRTLSDGSYPKLVTADDETIPLEISVATVSLSDRTVIYGIFRDVSEQVERERELEATTQRLLLALEGTDTGVWDWKIGTDDVRWTESLERLIGLEPGGFEGTFDAFAEYIHPDDRPKAIAAVERAVKTESQFQTEYRIRREDGTQIWVESRGEIYNRDENSKRMVGIVTDINERKQRETQLIRRTEAIEKAPVGIVLSDPSQPENPMVYTNQRFCELTGYEESEILGQNCRFMQGPKTDPESVAEIRSAIESEEPVSTVLRNYREDGTTFWNQLTVAPIRNEDGDVRNWVGFQEDATEHIEREQQLELAETVFNNTQDALFVIEVTEDHEFYIERVNDIYEELAGVSSAETARKTPAGAVGEVIDGEIESQYRKCVEHQESISYLETISVDGEQRRWEAKLTPVITEDRVDKLVGVMRDVTTT